MFRKEFVDRRKELEFLDKKYKEQGFEFIIASGRRRTGKSRLLKEFVKDKENILLLCEERKWQYNLSKFNKAVGKCLGIPNPNFDSFSDCFDFIVKQDRERFRNLREWFPKAKIEDLIKIYAVCDETEGGAR